MADTSKVQLRRVPGAELITTVTYTPFRTPELDRQAHSHGAAHWHPDAEQEIFEVSADIAMAAIATGGFEVTEDSRVALKLNEGGTSE